MWLTTPDLFSFLLRNLPNEPFPSSSRSLKRQALCPFQIRIYSEGFFFRKRRTPVWPLSSVHVCVCAWLLLTAPPNRYSGRLDTILFVWKRMIMLPLYAIVPHCIRCWMVIDETSLPLLGALETESDKLDLLVSCLGNQFRMSVCVE